MSFWNKIKQTFRSFLNGRYGVDALGRTVMWTGLALYLLGAILSSALVMTLGLLMNIYVIWRMFSRKIDARAEENRRFTTTTKRYRTRATQARKRFENRKAYKYFRCPSCKSWMKLKRGTGHGTVTCSRCKHSFEQQA